MNPSRAPLVLLLILGCSAPDGAPDAGSASAAPPSAKPPLALTTNPVGSVAASGAASAPPAAPARPLYFERAIAKADLEGRTLRELALMRNTIYARAGNSFRRPWLDAYFRAQPWYKPAERIDESKLSKLDKENARAIGDWDGAIPRAELEKMRDALLARRAAGAALPEDAVEASLLSQRLGVWIGEGPPEAASPLEDPRLLDKLVTVEMLKQLSRRDLRILRNTIYARRGRAFDSAVVRSYFEGASWYKPDPAYTDGRLSEIDAKNIAIIKSVEDSLGGPLHENPDYGKDGWFVQA